MRASDDRRQMSAEQIARMHHLDSGRVRANFDRSARAYDAHSAIPDEIGSRLLDQLSAVKLTPRRILDAGAGTGRDTAVLAHSYRRAVVTAIDLSTDMLALARQKGPRWRNRPGLVCGDLQRLPLRSGAFDLVFSNLSVHWCPSIDTALGELARVLRPGGLLAFATLGPDTLQELRECWAETDDFVHIHAFMDMHDIGDALVRSGLVDVVMSVDRLTIEYADLPSLLQELKRLGAGNATSGRRRTLTGKTRLADLTARYESRRRAGRLPATLEVVYAHAWQPVPKAYQVPVPALPR